MNQSWLTRIAWRWPSDQWSRRRITISTKRRTLHTRMSISRAMCQRSYHDENFTVTGILDDVVLVTSCADVDIVLTYLTIFVVTSVCHLLRRTLYPGTIVIDDIGISSDASLSTDDTCCIAQLRKKDTVCSGGNRKDHVHIFNVFLSQLFLWVRSSGNALRRCIWTSSFLWKGTYTYTLLRRIGSHFFLLHCFLRNPVREMIDALCRVSFCVCRRLRWKNSVTTVAFSFYAFGMEKSSLIWYSLFVKLWMTSSGQWSIRYVSDLVKYSAYHVDVNYTKQSLHSSVHCDDRRRFLPRRVSKLLYKRIILSIISLKNVSQRSVLVTFDFIVVTTILEHKWQSDCRRRIEVRQDSETQ